MCGSSFNYSFILDIARKNSNFGTSLLLANIGPNSPMSPKIVNASHVALFENKEIDEDFSNKLEGLQNDTKSIQIRVYV